MSDKAEKLQKLFKEMNEDETLPLKAGATNLVFGDGNPNARIMFIGEGPGYFEDIKGIPFVGNAGKFLDSLLDSIRLKREEIYITNVVHHRPPENRDPDENEIKAYGVYLDKIITIVDPDLFVTLGRFSMNKFLPGVFISSVHGREFDVSFNGKIKRMIPMYHPAAGLRNSAIKMKTIDDFKTITNVMKIIKSSDDKVLNDDKMQLSLL